MKNYGHKLGVITAMALAAALPERKLTKEFLESEIDKVEYNRFGETNTHCTITTKSGFSFTGESACVDPNNFDQKIGEKFAYENAFNKMWTPYGFWLHKALAETDYQSKLNEAQNLIDSYSKRETTDSGSVLPKTERLSFGDAVAALKEGLRVERAGWNGKGMWLTMVYPDDGANVPPRPAYAVYAVAGIVDDATNGCLPWIGMKTADNKFVPWLASQTDVLADDWQIVE